MIDCLIAGYGLAGSVFHAPLIEATAGMQVGGVVTTSPERAAAARSRHPAATVYPSVDDAVAARPWGLAVVATPNRFHVPLARRLMERGIATVVDKPLAGSLADAERLVEVQERCGVPLAVFHNRRWDGDFLTLRGLIADGRLGPPLRVESRFERFRPVVNPAAWRERDAAGEGGGLLLDLGSHLVDQALLLGGGCTAVYAELRARREGAVVDDDTFVALEFGEGLVAHLWMSAVTPSPGPRFRAWGPGGAYEKWGLDVQEAALRDGAVPGGRGWGEEPEGAWGRLTTATGDVETVATLAGDYPAFYAQMRRAVDDGDAPPVTAAAGLAVMRILDAARRSAQQGIVVTV